MAIKSKSIEEIAKGLCSDIFGVFELYHDQYTNDLERENAESKVLSKVIELLQEQINIARQEERERCFSAIARHWCRFHCEFFYNDECNTPYGSCFLKEEIRKAIEDGE